MDEHEAGRFDNEWQSRTRALPIVNSRSAAEIGYRPHRSNPSAASCAISRINSGVNNSSNGYGRAGGGGGLGQPQLASSATTPIHTYTSAGPGVGSGSAANYSYYQPQAAQPSLSSSRYGQHSSSALSGPYATIPSSSNANPTTGNTRRVTYAPANTNTTTAGSSYRSGVGGYS
eukprot:Filipodium_phascolosomae@DN6566_c0_g1_i1.p1